MIFRWSTPFRYAAAQARRLFAWMFDYQTMVSDAEWGRRRAICSSCPHLVNDEQCAICTCFVDAKAMLALERCPQKKWERVWTKKHSSGTNS
jgi:hypothetical protein